MAAMLVFLMCPAGIGLALARAAPGLSRARARSYTSPAKRKARDASSAPPLEGSDDRR